MSKPPQSKPRKASIPILNLYGNLEENFYHLGLKDREGHKLALTHIEAMLKTGLPQMDNLIHYLSKKFLKQTDRENLKTFKNQVQAYAEGLSVTSEKIMLALLTPELFSAMAAWIPGIPHTLLGCSSFFARTLNGDMLHGRILDFPLLGSIDLNERMVMFKAQKDKASLFSYSSAGFPYASLTVQNSHGVTFAIHQKFSKVLFPLGVPVFQAVHQMLENIQTPEDAIDCVSQTPTFTTWCFLFAFPNGERLAIDKVGEDIFIDRKILKPGEIEYFCNRLLSPNIDGHIKTNDSLPLGIESYNSMREKTAREKITQLTIDEEFDGIALLKLMSFPDVSHLKHPKKFKEDFKDWHLDTLTPSSLQAVVMNATQKTWHLNPGPAPKFFGDTIIKITDLFDDAKIDIIETKAQTKFKAPKNYNDYQMGTRLLMQSQVAWDLGNIHEAYHHIQMSKSYLTHTSYRWLPEFYFLVFEFIQGDHAKNRHPTLAGLKKLKNNIPLYQSELCSLYINILEKILGLAPTINHSDFKNPHLQTLYNAQNKMPPIILGKMLKFLIKPRIDVLDVIHVIHINLPT